MHHIVVNEIRELMFTITRLNVLAPRIAYNIHDEGGIAKRSAPKINDTRTQMMTTTTKAINRDCPDQTDSSNHVTLWDGSNYKRAA